MAYDEKLAARIRSALPPTAAISERKMFGGLAFMLDGKMFVGVTTTDLMVRVGAAGHAAALARPHVRPMDFTGAPLSGFVFVGAKGTRTAAALETWIARAMDFVATLPAKPRRPRRPRRPPKPPKRARRR